MRLGAIILILGVLSGCCRMIHSPVGVFPSCLVPDLEEPGCAPDAHWDGKTCVPDKEE